MTVLASQKPQLRVAVSVEEAVAILHDAGGKAACLAGGTWIMRGPVRGEELEKTYVSIGRIDELRAIEAGEREVRLGACITHSGLAAALARYPDCAGLVAAARGAANPAIREVATLGGNLCTVDFAAQDLVPALIALDADVELAGPTGRERLPLADFLARRTSLVPGTLLTCVRFARSARRAAHMRLPLRKAGDYPTAIVSLTASLDDTDRVADLRIAVGSVEAVARRWPGLEAALEGGPADPAAARAEAAALLGEFTPRESVEAPGWYRLQVLPGLVGRAVTVLRGVSESERP